VRLLALIPIRRFADRAVRGGRDHELPQNVLSFGPRLKRREEDGVFKGGRGGFDAA